MTVAVGALATGQGSGSGVSGAMESPEKNQTFCQIWHKQRGLQPLIWDYLFDSVALSLDRTLKVQAALLSAFAHLGISGSSPVEPVHIDFVCEFLNTHSAKLMPIQMEEAMQVFLIAKLNYKVEEQVEICLVNNSFS